jgi:hypothetical protein
MRYSFIILSFIGFFISCDTCVQQETSGDTGTLVSTDTAAISLKDSLYQDGSNIDKGIKGMFSVLVEHSATLFKDADTTSAILKDLSFNDKCFVPIEDILEMNVFVRCMHDSITGYVQRSDLFKTIASTSPEKKYLLWLARHDSVKVVRINTDKHLIEDQLNLENKGVYIRPHLVRADSWTETAAVIQVEMNPAACEATTFAYVIDYKDRLNFFVETSSYGDEGGSYSSELLFKKELLLHVVTTDAWQDDENGPTRYKTETTKFKWNGDSLVSVGIKK